MSQKSIVIVPGFWGDPASYHHVIDELSRFGCNALVVKLPSWGCEPPMKTLLDDAEAVRVSVSAFVDAGQEVVVAMHSAGGFIAPEGLKGLLAPDILTSGRRGGVPQPRGDYLWVKDPKHTLYSDLPAAEAEAWTTRLKHHPAYNYMTKTTQEPWRSIPSVFLKTANDAVIPAEMQDMFAKKIPGCTVWTCHCGHSPFLSQPSEVAKAIIEAAEKPSNNH